MIPTARVYALLCLGLAIASLLGTFWDVQLGIASILLWDASILGLMLLDSWRSSQNRPLVKRHPLDRLSIGRDNPVVIEVQSQSNDNNKSNNKDNDRIRQLKIRDDYPSEFQISEPWLSVSLAANASQEFTYSVQPMRRGEFKWGEIQVRQLGPMGLAWHDWKVPQTQTVAVYPDLVGLRSLSIRLALQSSGTMRQIRSIGIGTEFAELREYAIGDDPRLMDWKATARRSRPLVRVLEPEKEQTLIILLDRGRLMTARVRGLKRFDWGLNATLSLALAGLSRGDRVGVGVFDRETVAWIPPERGQHQLPKLISRLTPIEPVLLEPDYLGACTTLVRQQYRRALVVLITDIVDAIASAELLAALQRLTPRYLPFCVALRDPQVDTFAHTFTSDLQDAYARAVSLDLLAQRQVAFAKLKQKGVLVLDAPADKISDLIVDRYLQLKARNLL